MVALLTASLSTAERRRILIDLAIGDIDLVVGTHALLSETTIFANLGMVVVDEQHRFGVEQREALRQKAGGQDSSHAGHDGHTDPAHRGDDRLRRPRHVDAQPHAVRTQGDHHAPRAARRSTPTGRIASSK